MANSTTLDEILDKVRKLLRLSESDNPHEAAIAAARAQELLDRYEIDRAIVELEGEEPEFPDEEIVEVDQPLDSASKFNLDTWRSRLAIIVSKNNMCRIYTDTTRNDNKKHIIMVGRPSDVQKVRYLFEYLAREVERLCKRDGKGKGRTWRNNYRHGVVDTINKKITEMRAETVKKLKAGKSETALIKIGDALTRIEQRGEEVNDWLNQKYKLKGRTNYMRHNKDARLMGREAGEEVQIGSARGALSTGVKSLHE